MSEIRDPLSRCEQDAARRMIWFPASFMMPVGELAPFPVHVRDHAEELVLSLIKGDGLEGKIIHPGVKRLLQPFPDCYVAVRLSLSWSRSC